MQRKNRVWAICFIVLIWAVQAQAANFIGLGDLPGGVFDSLAMDVSADGLVVVGFSESGNSEAFRWTYSDGMVGLGFLPDGDWSRAYGVSADGSVIVGGSNSDHPHRSSSPIRWTSGSGMIELDSPVGYDSGGAHDVSADGSVVVGWLQVDYPHFVYRWTETDGMVDIGDFGEAGGVSADGSVVVGTEADVEGVPFRWTLSDGYEWLHGFDWDNFGWANSVSADGEIVVGSISEGLINQAIRWSDAGGMELLGDLPGGDYSSMALAASADGSVIVGFYSLEACGSQKPFIWDSDHGMRNLEDVIVGDFGIDLGSWSLHKATGISDDGKTVVGWGTNPDGQTEAWIAYLYADCVIELSLEGMSGGGRSLKAMRSFRDQVMHKSKSGRKLSELFYTHSPELSKIVQTNPKLGLWFARTLIKYGPAVESMLSGTKERVLSGSEVKQLAGLLSALAKPASPKLRSILVALRTHIESSKGQTPTQIWKRLVNRR